MSQVLAHATELQTAHVRVVTVSFDSLYWSQAWLKETESPFPFLRDTERVAYRAYGLQASRWRAWSPATVWYYAKARWQGRQSLGKRGDTHQLGGDFLIDPEGVIVAAHPSRHPADRVTVAQLLAHVVTTKPVA